MVDVLRELAFLFCSRDLGLRNMVCVFCVLYGNFWRVKGGNSMFFAFLDCPLFIHGFRMTRCYGTRVKHDMTEEVIIE